MGILRRLANGLIKLDCLLDGVTQWVVETSAAVRDAVVKACTAVCDTVMDFGGHAKVVLAPMAKSTSGIVLQMATALELLNGVAHTFFHVGIPEPAGIIIWGLAALVHVPHLIHNVRATDPQKAAALMFLSRTSIVGLTVWLMVITGSVFYPALIGFIALTALTIPIQLACLAVWLVADFFSALAFGAKRVADAMSVVATAMERGDRELVDLAVSLFRRPETAAVPNLRAEVLTENETLR